MNCRRTRTICRERELFPVPTDVHDAAERHLAGCVDCAEWVRIEMQLTIDLADLRVEPPREVDVTAKVLSGIRDEAPIRSEPVAPRQLGWAAAAALTCVLAVVSALMPVSSEIASLGRDAWSVTSGLARAAGAVLLTPAEGAVAAISGIAGNLVGALAALAGAAGDVGPFATGLISVFFVMMSATIALVVGRDFRRATWIERNGG